MAQPPQDKEAEEPSSELGQTEQKEENSSKKPFKARILDVTEENLGKSYILPGGKPTPSSKKNA